VNEKETREQLIDPALHQAGWTKDHIKIEETAGPIHIVGKTAQRGGYGRADYTLRLRLNEHSEPLAIALIEAKADTLPPSHGLEQGKLYADAKRLNVPFVFATNGYQFVQYDRFSGLVGEPLPMAQFPSPATLQQQYEAGLGFHLNAPAAAPLLAQYTGVGVMRRYYQDAAIRATLEKIARCEAENLPRRALLSLATGAGKTFIAVQLLKRIADAGLLRRALFVCDRDELRTQADLALQGAFGANAAKVSVDAPQKNARILIATYQTLGVAGEEDDATFLTTHYPEDYFSHIVIDECHRSAWGKWSEVLDRNPGAVQIGLTATPRRIKTRGQADPAAVAADQNLQADNIRHFGEPVYEYDMGQGIEDGYLAACEIVEGRVNLDATGLTLDDVLKHRPKDAITGQKLGKEHLDELYTCHQYEQRIMLPDRVAAMCADLFLHLLDTGGPHQKTIIFCARDAHAQDVSNEMNNLYAHWCAQNDQTRAEPYAFKCTAQSAGGDFLPEFRASSQHHFIATTVDLLTTGVDIKPLRNVAFFRYVQSPISFYQMVGRGTRIDAPSDKLMFRVYDYTNASRLFGEEFFARPASQSVPGDENDPAATNPATLVRVSGFDVQISPAGRFIVTQVDGKAARVTLEEYRAALAQSLTAKAATPDEFRARWVLPSSRAELMNALPDAGRSALLVQELYEMKDYDLFDVLGQLAYGLSPMTRAKRAQAFGFKNRRWLDDMAPGARSTLMALARQFAAGGTEGLENPLALETPDILAAGGIGALMAQGDAASLVREAKTRMFAA
jgi:type I restriction enzyme R subunit